MIKRIGSVRIARTICATAIAMTGICAKPALAQTWVGPGTDWNTASNWSPFGVPNSPTAAVSFTGLALGNANISSSVQAQSLSFSNPTGSYTLTSNAGVILSGVTSINVAAVVTGTQTINLANISGGSLQFPGGNNLTITNNSTAPGTTLVVGPNTVIGTPGSGGVIVNGAGTTNISGTFATVASGNHIVGGLTKNGTGTLILSSANNVYFGGTNVNGGTLQLGAGTAIPTGSNVTVASGATFSTGGFSNGDELSSSNAISALSLNGGTFRVPSGNGDYWLNQLNMTGGTVDFTGSGTGPGFWLHFSGAGSAININANPTTTAWIGSGASRIQNDTAAPLSLFVNAGSPSGIDLDAGIILSGAGTNNTFNKTGAGTMRLTNPANTANFQISGGTLRVDDMAALGSGTATINGGYLLFGGTTAVSNKPLFLQNGGSIEVITNGTNLTLNGAITETGGTPYLAVFGANPGASTLTLTNTSNNYSGATIVSRNAVLAIPTIANGGALSPIGRSSNAPLNLRLGFPGYRGTLLLTGTNSAYSTDRGATLFGTTVDGGGGVIGVQNATTNLTWSGQITGSGTFIKNGAGTLTLTNTTNNFTGGTIIEAGTLRLDGPNGAGIIPAGTNVTVRTGATLNQAAFVDSIPNPNNPLGTITLDGGTLRLSDNANRLYLNQLVVTGNGGLVDLTPPSPGGFLRLSFVNPGAGITVNGNVTVAGPGASYLRNETSAELPITVSPSVTLTSGVSLISNTVFDKFRVTGGGTLQLASTPMYSAHVRVSQAQLRMDNLANVSSTFLDLTLDNGALTYGGPTQSWPATFALGPGGGVVQFLNVGTNLTISGAISESAPGSSFTVYGPGLNPNERSTLTVTANNSYTGPTQIALNSILAIPTIGNSGTNGPLGASSNAPGNLRIGDFFNRGDLLLTGTNPTYSTDRGVTFDNFIGGGGGIGVQNAATTLVWNGQITGFGSLSKTGAGTLTLTNATNNYSGTLVEQGKLVVGASGAVIPANSNVSVQAGATFQIGPFFGHNSLAPIGTISLDGGVMSVIPDSSGFTSYYANRFVSGASGGTVNLSTTLIFDGAGVGATINGPTTWNGPGAIVFFSPGDLSIAPGVTLNSNALCSAAALRLQGGGTFNVTASRNDYGLRLTVAPQTRVSVNDLGLDQGYQSVLGSTGYLTLDGGILQYTGPTVTSAFPIALGTAGGVVEVSNAATTLSLTGSITGAGPFTKSGPGTMILTNTTNPYYSGIVVNSGRLEIGNDNQLGQAAVTINPAGTVRFTNSTTTARTYTMFNGSIDVPSGVTLTMNGATVYGGFLHGTGTFVLSGGTSLTGVTTFNSTNLNVTGPASLSNFAHNGNLTVVAGQTLSMSYATNGAAGLININGTANVGDFTSYGRLAINPGGTVNNTQGAIVVGGGSVTSIGIYNPANGQVTPGGSLNIGAGGMRVQGGFVRNNGTITGNGNLIIDYLGLVKGAGDIDLPNAPIRINGGQLLAGNSPGLTRITNFSLVSTGVTGGDFSNATGIAGPPIGSTGAQLSGFSVFEYGNSTNTGGSARVEGTPASRAIWQFRTVIDGGDYSTAGVPANFNAAQSYTWNIVRPRSAADVANPNNITPINTVAQLSIFDTATMTSVALNDANLNAYLRFDDTVWNWGSVPVDQRGTFSFVLLPDALGAPNRVIGVAYSPVPEATYMLAVAFFGFIGLGAGRRRVSAIGLRITPLGTESAHPKMSRAW